MVDLRGWCAAAAARQFSPGVVPEPFCSPGAAPGHWLCSRTDDRECDFQGETAIFIWRHKVYPTVMSLTQPAPPFSPLPSKIFLWAQLSFKGKHGRKSSETALDWTWQPWRLSRPSPRVITSANASEKRRVACCTPSYKLLSLTTSGQPGQQSHLDGTDFSPFWQDK